MAISAFPASQCHFLKRGVAVVANGAEGAVAEWHDCVVGVYNVLVLVVVDYVAVVAAVVAGGDGSGSSSDHADVDAIAVHAHGSVVVVVVVVRVAAVAAVDAATVHQETRGGSTDRTAWSNQTTGSENDPEAMIATTRTTT